MPLSNDAEQPSGPDALFASDTRIKAMFEGIHTGIGLCDMSGRFLATNQALQQMLGVREDELRGRFLFWDMYPDDMDHMRELLDELYAGKRRHAQIESRYRHTEGHSIWVRLIVSMIHTIAEWEPFVVVLVEDITNSKQVDIALSEMKRALAEAREHERLRLAQDLHDGPVQHLLGISYQLDLLSRLHPAQQDLALLSMHVLDSVSQLRSLISQLRPAGLLELGLTAALEGFIARLEREHPAPMPVFALALDESGTSLPEHVALCLFRVGQEAIRNAIRHACATTIEVTLLIYPTAAVLRVRDNGCGFVLPTTLGELTRADHFGLAGIIEQVELAGGTCTIITAPEAGTEVIASVYYQPVH